MVIFLTGYMARFSKRLKPDKWAQMSGLKFETQIVNWLKAQGYIHVKRTEYFDRGIDIVAVKDGFIYGIQVKRSAKDVGVAAVRSAVAGLAVYGCHRAMVISNANFTRSAIALANANNCLLVNGSKLESTVYAKEIQKT